MVMVGGWKNMQIQTETNIIEYSNMQIKILEKLNKINCKNAQNNLLNTGKHKFLQHNWASECWQKIEMGCKN